ncbi:MAG: hypothetical protein V4606_01570 [Patescibacteria group bacterium]
MKEESMDGTRSFNNEQTCEFVHGARSSGSEKESSPDAGKTSELGTLITEALERLEEFAVVQDCVRRWVRETGYHYRSCVASHNILTITYAEEFLGEKRQLLITVPANYMALLPSDRIW